MKVRDIEKIVRRDGWFLIRTRGSHRHFRHDEKPGLVTIAGQGRDDLLPKTLKSILKQAGLPYLHEE